MKKLYLALALMASLGIAGCDNEPEMTEAQSQPAVTETETVKESSQLPDNAPTYNVATISTFTPFILRDENGKTVGFDVDILKAIGEKEGFNVEYLVVPWEGIFDTVATGSHDIISSAVVINPERQQLVDFSDPYIDSGRMAVVREELKDKTFDELKELTFVTQMGTSNVPIIESFISNKNNLMEVETQYLEIKSVVSGEADVAFDDARVMQYYVAQTPGLHGIEYDAYEGDLLGFAVQKGNKELLDKINSGLAAIKADGTYDEIYEKWFGEKPTP